MRHSAIVITLIVSLLPTPAWAEWYTLVVDNSDSMNNDQSTGEPEGGQYPHRHIDYAYPLLYTYLGMYQGSLEFVGYHFADEVEYISTGRSALVNEFLRLAIFPNQRSTRGLTRPWEAVKWTFAPCHHLLMVTDGRIPNEERLQLARQLPMILGSSITIAVLPHNDQADRGERLKRDLGLTEDELLLLTGDIEHDTTMLQQRAHRIEETEWVTGCAALIN